MDKLRVLSAAEREYTDALCWYSARSLPAAEKFDADFAAALEMIEADPLRFPICAEQHRYYLMSRFPYQIIYRYEAGEVLIVAVAHVKRFPDYWTRR